MNCRRKRIAGVAAIAGQRTGRITERASRLCRLRCFGGSHSLRSRECLFAFVGASQSGSSRCDLGIEDASSPKVGTLIAESLRIGFRSVGRFEFAQGVYQASSIAIGCGFYQSQTARCAAPFTAGVWQIRVLQSPGQRNRSSGGDAGCRESDGLACRSKRRANPRMPCGSSIVCSMCLHDR